MTSKEFYREFGNIDPKMVEAAAPAEKERGNKKKVLVKWMTIAACIALLLTMVGTVWALTLQTPKSTYDTISDLAETKDGVFKLDVLDQKEIFTDFSVSNLKNIMTAFDVIVEKNDVVEFPIELFLIELFNENQIPYQKVDSQLIVKTDVDSSILKYAMYVSVYFVNFPDSVYRFSDPRDNRNADMGNNIIIFFDYENYGFESAYDCISAYSEWSSPTYQLSSYEIDMFNEEGNTLSNPTPNLLDFLTDQDSIRIQRAKGTYVPKVDYSEEEF